MNKQYDALRNIKNHREEKKRGKVLAANHEMELCRTELQHAEEELSRYQQWRQARQEEIYSELHGKPAMISELELYRSRFAALIRHEEKLSNAVKNAQQAVDRALAELQVLKKALSEAMQAKEKFELFLKQQHAEEEKKQKLTEENELDELASIQHSNNRMHW